MLTLVTVAALAAVTVANSDSDPYSLIPSRTRFSQQCAGYCKAGTKFNLRSGYSYIYNYEGTTATEVVGASNDSSQVKITAKALITILDSQCDLVLQLQEVQLYDSGNEGLVKAERQKEFAATLQASPLRFSFQDGRIDQLCPSADESILALNLKRGLLSAFQNTMVDLAKGAHLYERDVSGSCETSYSVRQSMWSDVKVLRRKDLQSCSGRGYHTLGLSSTFSDKPKSVPIVKSEQYCEQTIDVVEDIFLRDAKCTETHVLAPFSNGQSGIRTTSTLSLTLDKIVGAEPIPSDLFVNTRTSLQFDFSSLSTEQIAVEEDVWNTLKQLTKGSSQGVGKEVPRLFDQLISQLSNLDDQQLVKLFDQVREQRLRQFLMDALPLVGTAGSVSAIYQIYQAQEISRDELDSWLTALAFHKKPSLDLIRTLNVFVQEDFHPKAWLAVSAVVHAYCRQDSACTDKPEVQQLMIRVEQVLGETCRTTTTEQQERVITALKAIGNAGFITSMATLNGCFMSNSNQMEVRLAAVSATRRFPCNKMQQLPMLQVFQDRSQDTELRIAAYLAALQCPTTAMVSRIRDALYQEDTNQVLSFVWTHLTNLQESTSSWRTEVREMLRDNHLANKFRTDVRKFSRNYETSFYSDVLDSGATVDSNVVFSTKSYLPRSATLNLTLDLFGESVNVFEVGTRMEGFESMVENLFSKKGLFPDESMEKMLYSMRTANDETNEVIQTFSEQFTKDIVKQPQGTMYARIFGNELYLTQFNSLSKFVDQKVPEKNSLKYLTDSLSSLFTNKKVDYTKSFRFLNSKYMMPTILGLPLRLEVNGTASLGIELSTDVDLTNVFKTKSGNLILSCNPSTVVKIDGKMIVDAYFTEAGVETKGSLSSNTYLDTKMTIEKGQVIDISLNVPREKVEVVNVSSAVYIRRREGLVEIEGVGEVTERDTCVGKYVPTVSGMRLCSQVEVRNASAVEDAPYFPLTGRFQYALGLYKSDFFNSYQLHLKQIFGSKNGRYNGKFLLELDTPGSRLDRRLLADLGFDSGSGDASLELASPAGSVVVTGKLGLSEKERSLDVRAQVGGQDYAVVRLALETDSSAKAVRYEPSLLLQAQPNLNISVAGRLNIVPGNKYNMALSASGFTSKPIAFSGDFSAGKGRYLGSLSAKAEALDVKVSGKLVSSPSTLSCKVQARYVLRQSSVQGMDFSAKIQNYRKGGFHKKHLWINLQMTELPEYSTKATWILYHTQKYFDSNFDLTFGKSQWKGQQLYHNNMLDKNKNFEIILSLESPTKNVDCRAEIQYKTTDDTVHSHGLAQLSKRNKFISRLDYTAAHPQHRLELEAATPWEIASLEAVLDFLPPSDAKWDREVKGVVFVKWGDFATPRWISATGLYKKAETLLSARHGVDVSVERKEWEEPLQVKGEWFARSVDGLILSNTWMTLIHQHNTYKLLVDYGKNPSFGKQDLSARLILPENSYSSEFVLINSPEIKNVTVRLDLEKSIYFTSQLDMWKAFDLELFWDYLEDPIASVAMRYKSSVQSEVAVISMPGHYALLTVDKLGPGFSSMNVTAIWGEAEDSANNAILLSTFWLLDTSPWYAEQFWLPTVRTKVHLITPFLGFERQSFSLSMNGSADHFPPLGTIAREIQISTKWQDQFIDFQHHQIQKYTECEDPEFYGQSYLDTTFTALVTSSIKALKEGKLNIKLHDKKHIAYSNLEKIEVDASYNNEIELLFNFSCPAELLKVSSYLKNRTENNVIFSADLSIYEKSIDLQSVLPSREKVLFTSTFDWPKRLSANLSTPFKGYEKSAAQFDLLIDGNNANAKLSGNLNTDYIQVIVDFNKSLYGFHSNMNLSSSSPLPDITVMVEHSFRQSHNDFDLKDTASVVLSKGGKHLQTGQVFLSFVDDQRPYVSIKTKQLQTVLQLPGHYSSSNYSYQSQIKISGVEIQHLVMHAWNKENTDISLIYEGLSSVYTLFNRNGDKKAEFAFKNFGNGNIRTDISLDRKYFVKHRFYFEDHQSWENFLMVSSPLQKVVVKNLQTSNVEKTNFVHKSTVVIDKEVAQLDFVVDLDSNTHKLDSFILSTITPWTHPTVAKYDLIVDTGATKKHELQLQFRGDKEIKLAFDTTVTVSQYSTSFSLYSPYCQDLEGSATYAFNEINSKGNAFLKINRKRLTAEVELVKSFSSPSFKMSLANSDENMIHLSCSYNALSKLKHAILIASYFGQEIKLKSHCALEDSSIKAGVMLNTPFGGWNEVSVDFDSVLSHKYSMIVLSLTKDEKYVILSGTGTFQNDLLKSSVSLDYMLSDEPKKHSAVVELSRGQESVFVLLSYESNEVSIIEFNVKYIKEMMFGNEPVSHMFFYKAHLPFENFPDTSFDVKSVGNSKQQIIVGKANVGNWESTIKGENTFDEAGIGYLSLKFLSGENKVEVYIKHVLHNEKDSFVWNIENNNSFLKGTITILSVDKNIQAQFGMESSLKEINNINSNIIIERSQDSFVFNTLSIVNDNNYTLKYNATFENGLDFKTEHDLLIALPLKRFENIRGSLEYRWTSDHLTQLKVELTDGVTQNHISYVCDSYSYLKKCYLNVDLPKIFSLSTERNESSIALLAKTTASELFPKILLNLTFNTTRFDFVIDGDIETKVKIEADLFGSKLRVSGVVRDLNASVVFEQDKDNVVAEFSSNIPNWIEIGVLVKHKTTNKINEKYTLSFTKNREELAYITLECFYNKFKGENLFTLTMPDFIMDLSINYDLSSNFSVDLAYNINGNKQQAEGKLSFLPESTRIDLATPMKGFEDLTLIGSLNRKNKTVGLVLYNSGKQFDVEVSSKIENNLVTLKGTFNSEGTEFTLTIGARNGTSEDPSAMSIYINALRNKQSVLWLSFEGSHNIEEKAGLKLSFSSQFYKQLYFEIYSHKEGQSHTVLFNYIYGIDVVYMLKTVLAGNIASPSLVIVSHFNSQTNYFEAAYDFKSSKKVVTLYLKQNEIQFLKLNVEAILSSLSSSFNFELENSAILNDIEIVHAVGEYNFQNKTVMKSYLIVNNVKYFNLVLESSSLCELDFHSSLLPSNYINNYYDAALSYSFSSPSSNIFSKINMSGDYYLTTANVTWEERLANIFFDLKTNAGYGFKNVVLSANYFKTEETIRSHLFNLSIDESTLFHTASTISYPSMVSVDIILPDSYFLPHAKEIRVFYNNTKEEKTGSFKYLSSSNENKRIDCYATLHQDTYKVKLYRSEVDSENNFKVDNFTISYNKHISSVNFHILLVLENRPLFTANYQKVLPGEKLSLQTSLLYIKNSHFWNISAGLNKSVEFTGKISPTDMSMKIQSPSIRYLKMDLSELVLTKTKGPTEFFKLYFKNDLNTESSIMYTNFKYSLFKSSKKNNDPSTTNVMLIYHNRAITLHHQHVCEDISQCQVFINIVGATEKPIVFNSKLYRDEGEVHNELSVSGKSYSFGGKVGVNSGSILCSDIKLFFNSSTQPDKPFAVMYETNCEDRLFASINFFERIVRKIYVDLEYNETKVSGFKVQSMNSPWVEDLSITGKLLDNMANLDIHLQKEVVYVELHYSKNNHTMTVESSYDVLKSLEISNSMNDIKGKYFGKFKIKGSKASTEWVYSLSHSNNGSLVCHIISDKAIEIEIVFNSGSKIEMFVKLNKAGKMYEGKGTITHFSSVSTILGDAVVSVDGKEYIMNFERYFSSKEHNALMTLKTPTDEYYLASSINNEADFNTPIFTLKYKTPFHPLDYADLKIRYSSAYLKSQEYWSFNELEPMLKTGENYTTKYNEILLGMSLKTKSININDAKITVMYGDKYGASFSGMLKKVAVAAYSLQNNGSLAFQCLFDIQGFETNNLHILKGKSSLTFHLNYLARNAFASIKTPFTKNILLYTKCTDCQEYASYYNGKNRTSELKFGENTILKLISLKHADKIYEGRLNGNWKDDNTLKFNYKITKSDVHFTVHVIKEKQNIVSSEFWYIMENMDSTQLNTVKLHVHKLFSIHPFYPSIVLKQELTDQTSLNLKLNFTNGVTFKDQTLSGSLSLNVPNVRFSTDVSNPPIYANATISTYSKTYEVNTELSVQHNKLDSEMSWRKVPLTRSDVPDADFSFLRFGGAISENTMNIYLDENKLSAFYEKSNDKTKLFGQWLNNKHNKNMTFVADLLTTPMYLLTISHTFFDSPCSITVKVDKQKEYVESAVSVVYNNAQQEAFVNIYLDSNPQYAELMYLDIWQQTHEASIHFESKDNEVTVRAKINSPALDENFLIVTIGNSNDKFDLNINDAFIFKAFKDDRSGLLDIFVSESNYKLQYKCESQVEITIVSPKVNGVVSFSFVEINKNAFLKTFLDIDLYHFKIEASENNVYTTLRKEENYIFDSYLTITNELGGFELDCQCNILSHINKLSVQQNDNPMRLLVKLQSPYYLKNNLEIVLEMENKDVLKGNLEVRQIEVLFKSFLSLAKLNNTIEINIAAPLFTEMDRATFNGVYNIFGSDGVCEVRFSAHLESGNSEIAQSSLFLVKNDEVFTSGLVVKSQLKTYENIEVSILLPRYISRDMKADIIVQLPTPHLYQLSFALCRPDDIAILSAIAKWQELVLSAEFKRVDSPFYSDMFEWNIQYLKTKLQIAAWMEPKYPLTDYIYYVDLNKKRVIEVSHALVLEQNHFKSKAIVETVFEGHEKYGIDLELQNLKVGKIIKLLGSAPQLGKDLGIDFGFSYESLLNYAVLGKIRIPHSNTIRTAQFSSMQLINPKFDFIKMNHTLDFSELGTFGWEFKYIYQINSIWLESLLNLNSKVYLLKSESFFESQKANLDLHLETPFELMRKGAVHLSGTKDIVGSELTLSLNSNEIVNVNITKDSSNTKEVIVLSKWRSILVRYLFDEDKSNLEFNGYFCWDLLNKNVSQLGLSVKRGHYNKKQEMFAGLILPSKFIPKLGVKATFKKVKNEFFCLAQVDFPGLVIEGKLAKQTVQDTVESGIQLKWTTPHSTSKNMGLFYIAENSDEEIKHHFTLQHFSLDNDITLSLYNKITLYGVHLQYSPLKEEEVIAEFVHWFVEADNSKERSGIKITLLHPASNTLIYSVVNLTSTSEYTQTDMSVAYTASQTSNKIKYVEVYGRKSKKTPDVVVGLASNGNSLRVGGSIWRKENYLRGVTLEAQVNQRDPLRVEVVQNILNPGIEAEFSYSSSKRYTASAGMPNSNEITAKLTHSMYGKQSMDAFASIRLNTSKILWGKLELPPISHVAQELYSGVMEEYVDASLVSQSILNGYYEFIQEDFSKKIVNFLDAVLTQSNVLIHATAIETEVIVHTVEGMGNITAQLYDDDHFYLQTLHHQIKKFGEAVHKHVSCAVDVVTKILSGLTSPLSDVASRVWRVVQPVLAQWRAFVAETVVGGESPMKQATELLASYRSLRSSLVKYSRQAASMVQWQLALAEQRSGELLAQTELLVNELTRKAEQELSVQLKRIMDYKDTVVTGFSILQNTMEEMLDIVISGLYWIKEVRYSTSFAVKHINAINSWITNFQVEVYFQAVESYISKIFKLVLSDFEKNFGEYKVYLDKANNLLAGQYEELNRIPQVQYIQTAANIVYQKVKWFWNYAKLNEKLQSEIEKYLTKLKGALDDLESQLDSGEKSLRTEYSFVAENNSLTFTQELPFEWKSFTELPEYNMDFNTKALYIPTHEYSNMVQTTVNHLWQDAKLLPYLLPPFGADALFSGDNFITFDNSFFHFNGNCNSYLLAADLYHNTFSLFANYDRQNKRNIVLMYQGVEILVKNNLEVYSDGELLELPNTINLKKSITFERKVHSVVITCEDGLTLECTSFQDMCRLHLSGWYMGKTAGLLGTYNNEASDDFITAKREQTESIEQFTSAWAVDTKRCETEDSPSLALSAEDDARPYESMCELFFNSQSSPFYPCFHVVDPKAFSDMCQAAERNKNTCSSVMAYITKCALSGVQLWMPEFCVDSTMPDATLLTGYSDIVEVPSKMSADVVFVVEEAECVKRDLLSFGVLVNSLNSDLMERGLADNKYAFLSFHDEHADINTIGGEIWTSNEALLAAAVSRHSKYTETSPAAFNSALDLAASLPFRPGAAKVVVLIHCSSCSFSENYANTLERFKENDITLHILQKDNLMGKKGKMISKAIGLEKSGAYPRKGLNRNIAPSSQLLQQVTVPQDMCTPIMMNTNGTLFHLDVTRKSLSTWTGRVAEGAVPSVPWQQCERVMGRDNVPTWHCHRASPNTKLKDWDQTALEEYMDSSRVAEFYTEYEDAEP